MGEFDVFNPLKDIELHLTEDQITEITEWFDANCKLSVIVEEEPSVNAISVENFRKFLDLKKYHRRNFHYPSYGEIMDEVEKLKAGLSRFITKDQFIYMINKWIIEADIKHEIKLAFEVFDTEKRNFLDIDEVKTIVTRYGDAFNEDEIRELLFDANSQGDGNVFYKDFVESLFSIAPELYELKAEYLYEDPNDDPSVPPEVVEEEVIAQPVVEEPIPTKKQKKKK